MKRKKKAYAFVEYNLKNTEILKKKKDEAPGVIPRPFTYRDKHFPLR